MRDQRSWGVDILTIDQYRTRTKSLRHGYRLQINWVESAGQVFRSRRGAGDALSLSKRPRIEPGASEVVWGSAVNRQ